MKQCNTLVIRESKETAPKMSTANRSHTENRFNVVVDVCREIGSMRNIETMLEKIIDCALELVDAERGVLLLYPQTGSPQLEAQALRNMTLEDASQITAKINRSITVKHKKNQPPFIIVETLAKELHNYPPRLVSSDIHSVVCAPLLIKGEIWGILYLDNRAAGFFHEEGLKMLECMINLVGLSLENTNLVLALEKRINETDRQLELANAELEKKNQALEIMNQALKRPLVKGEEVAAAKRQRILIADDQALFCDTLKFLLEQDQNIEVVGCVNNGRAAFEFCREMEPDIVLMDIRMAECDGVEGTRLIKTKYPKIKVIILTTFDDQPTLAGALSNGADGYILKEISAADLLLAIKNTAQGFGIIHKKMYGNIVTQFQVNRSIRPSSAGEVTLSNREIQIIRLVTEGKENREIAKSLYLGEGRVKNILTGILKKLQVKDRTQLAVYAIKNNLV